MCERLFVYKPITGTYFDNEATNVRGLISYVTGDERQSLKLKESRERVEKHTFLGLLAKIKCSICSYQFNI